MRLGYLVPEFPLQTHIFFWREIVALRSLGVEVHLLSTRRAAPDACKHAFAKPAAAETHYVFPPRWLTALGTLAIRPLGTLRALRYIAGLRETPLKKRLKYLGLLLSAADLLSFARQHRLDHIHVHSCADAAHLAALCRLLGGPSYSLTLHGDLPVYGTDHASKMQPAKFVSCVTGPLQKQVMSAVGLPAERAPIIWMGVDTERFHDAGQRAHQPGKLHLTTVARLNAMKGHRFALAAIRKAVERGCDLRYTIVGEGEYRPQIEETIRTLGLTERVALTGTQSEDAILELLKTVDAFILPSVGLGEAAPVSVMEAMACGLPVICSIIGGTPDMIASGANGILAPQEDEKAIEEALVLLCQNVEERRRLGQAARQRAVEAFDARQTAGKLLAAMQGK